MAVRAGRLFLIAAWLCVCAGCGDGASEPLGADAAAFDVNDVSPDAKDVILDAQDVALDAEDLISDAEDVVLDPQDLISDAEDVVLDPQDLISDAEDVVLDPQDLISDTEDDVLDAEDVVLDAKDVAEDTIDPTCPYNPKTYCLHWGVCKTVTPKLDCSTGEPLCDYSGVPGYELVEKACDGLDNDCNNLVDDDLNAPLASKQGGICGGQVKICSGTAGWQDPDFSLSPLYQSVEDACDGLDNDCDGQIDGFLTPKKLVGVLGVCAEGTYTCGGALGWQKPELWSVPFWEPVETMCDDLDNDCDGLTDEDMQTPNFLGSGVQVNNQGVCNGAWIRCLAGVWSAPDYTLQPGYEAEETSCDGLDNDCNGLVDELMPELASKQAGVCAGQTLVCNGKIGWQDPDWSLLPSYATDTEWQCDGLDNDCDGLTDEDALCPRWQSGGRSSGKVALSPDGASLAWTTLQGAQVLDWQTRTVTREWFGHDHAVRAVAFSPDGLQLATSGQLDVLQVWPLAAPVTPDTPVPPLLDVGGLGTTFAAVAFSPDGGKVAVGDASGTVRVYAMWSGLQVAAYLGHKAQVAAIAWLADAQGQNGVLLSGDDAGAIWRWQPSKKTGEQIALMPDAVRAIAAMPDTTHALLVAESQAIVVDATTGAPLFLLKGANLPLAGGALRQQTAKEALVLDATGAVRRYALPPAVDLMLDLTPVQTIVPPPEVADDIALSLTAAGGHVAVGFQAQGPWQLDVATATWTRAAVRHDGAVRDAAVTGGLLLTAGDDAAIRLWRAADAHHLFDLWGHTGAVLALVPLTQLPTPSSGADLQTLLGNGLGLASGSDDFTVRLWQLTPTANGVGVLTPKIFGLGGPWPEDLALTADVPGIWAAGGPTLGKYATDPAKPGQKLNAYPTKLGNIVERVVPSPDGQSLALGLSGDGAGFNVHYRVVSAKTFAVVQEWAGLPGPVHAVAWSGDGTRLAVAAPNGVIAIADVQSGDIIQQLYGHTAPITALSWSAAGRLLSTSEDGTARVWSAGSGKALLPVGTFTRHCPTPCTTAPGGKIAVLGGVWQDTEAHFAITFASDGSVFGWKGPSGP